MGGMDEVGRGALAGPVCVGIVVIDAQSLQSFPSGLADSKTLSSKKRQVLQPVIMDWVLDWAIGESSNDEIDELGIMAALRSAGWRALTQLDARGHLPQLLLLDGNINYLQTEATPDLFNLEGKATISSPQLQIENRVRADAKCASVAAAAILAKEYRDAFMRQLPDEGYGWEHNVGYGTRSHRQAIARLGPSRWHRRSWKLI